MSSTHHPVIAVDGTAASGKSTFSRELARRLGFAYVNTGAMYRGVTWYLQQKGVPLGDTNAVAREIKSSAVTCDLVAGELRFTVGGHDPLPHVREAGINEGVSLVAQVREVRQLLVAEQQRLVERSALVMEGRDIGTAVFPATPYKFYLDASAEVRAQRRQAQGEVDVIRQRDIMDSQRVHSPLICAADAKRLDSGSHAVDELVAMALQHLEIKGLVIAGNLPGRL
jgi:cytidylate kinase